MKHYHDEKEYALKQTYKPPKTKEMEHCKREIAAISELLNPHLVRYFGTFQDRQGRVYIQMEICGKDLEAFLEDNELIETKIRPHSVTILEQLLRGLDYIHSKGLIHRDLKPSNIFVKIMNRGVFVNIGDFGLVSFEDDSKTSHTGSPLYRAPEQLNKKYDCKVDMYTLGIDLFEIRKRVNEESFDWSENIKKLRKNTAITLTEFEPFEPKGWKQLISDLLQEIPEKRPTAGHILRKLTSILYGGESSLKRALETDGPGMINLFNGI